MELVTYDLKVGKEPFFLMPLGDIQWAGQRGPTAKDLLRREIDRGLEHKAWFLGMGDYIDFLSPSNRARLREANLFDTAEDVIDDKALELTEELYEKFLKPTRGKWLGLLEGHHFTQLKTGETTDQYLCRKLGTVMLGTTAYIRLCFRRPLSTAVHAYLIWAAHGCGGGMKISAPLNRLENLAPYWHADLFLMGHMTKMPAGPINRIWPDFRTKPPSLEHRKILLVGTGGFAKGYVEGSLQGRVPRGNYVEQRLLSPAALGAPLVRIHCVRRRAGGGDSLESETTVEC